MPRWFSRELVRRIAIVPIVLTFGMVSRIARAQIEDRSGAVRSESLAGSDIASPHEPSSSNPALTLASVDGTRGLLRATYQPQPFGLEQAWMGTASVALQVDSVWVAAVEFGKLTYQDVIGTTRAGLLASRRFSAPLMKQAVAGVRLRYQSTSFGDRYLPINEMTADVGVAVVLSDEWQAGFAATDLLTLYQNQRVAETAPEFSFGAAFEPVASLTLLPAFVWRPQDDFSVRCGVEYVLVDAVTLRVGAETSIGLVTGGIGLHLSDLNLDFAFERHPDLGSSVDFGITYGL